MRIVGGEFKGRRIAVPSNFPSRPTTDFAKEGLFNVLENQFDLTDMKVLDLCSGTGNISLEFLSRGVEEVTSVDSHTNCLKFVQKNASSIGILNKIKTVKSDLQTFILNTNQTFDIIFADPPFNYDKYSQIVKTVFERELLNENGILILEHSKQKSFDTEPKFSFFRNYGNVTFSFFKK
jgi:16S rRNA (guanine(966)-N(2))-methyltransferase RsmD